MSCSPSGSSHKLHIALLFFLRAKEKVAGEKHGESERDRETEGKKMEEAGWVISFSRLTATDLPQPALIS